MLVHEVIRKYRMTAGMSQLDLAKATGYSDQSAISKIEAGKVDLPRSKLKTFSRVLNIPMNLLVEDEPLNQVSRTPRLPEATVIAISAAGLTVEPGFGVLGKDFNDMVGLEPPPEIYNILDLKTASLARFTGDELRALEPEPAAVRKAYNDRSITGTTAKAVIYKMIDSLPDDKLSRLEAYVDGMLGL